jgi:capsular polysaccharide transport system ATP-binding protein
MIELREVRKTYHARSGPVDVLKGVNLRVERGDKFGIVGRNGSGKSTLIRLLGGVEEPTSGKIEQTMRVSWPLAFTGAFQGALTGMDNIRFICRVYGKRFEDVIDFVEDFSQLGRFLKEPVKIYSSGMRARLAFAVSLMIDFDCYLIDEVVAVGDAKFQRRSHEELFEVRGDRAIIIVSHDPNYMRLHCDTAAVLEDGRLRFFDEVEHAFEYHSEQMMS